MEILSKLAGLLIPAVKHKFDGGRETLLVHKDYSDVSRRPERKRTFLDINSLIAYAKNAGDQNESALFYNDDKIIILLDEVWEENSGVYRLINSTELRAWINSKHDQDGMIELLQCWGATTLEHGEDQAMDLLKQFCSININTKINYDATIEASKIASDDIKVVFDKQTGGGSVDIPVDWKLIVPIYEGLDPLDIELKLKMTAPKDVDQKPMFSFKWQKRELDLKRAAEQIKDILEDELKGWKIYFGSV